MAIDPLVTNVLRGGNPSLYLGHCGTSADCGDLCLYRLLCFHLHYIPHQAGKF